jgi:uncharacterized membrane protein
MANIIGILEQTSLGSVILTFLASLLPVLELRFAIPFGISLGLDPRVSFAVSIIGNMLPAPFIILFARKIFAWMRRKSEFLGRTADNLEKRAEGKWQTVQKFEFFALLLFVAIPLPGTGAWTGALIAAIMNVRIKRALPPIFLGVIIAGFLVTGISIGFLALF